jgi:membrane associated rhomboid family serine protease
MLLPIGHERTSVRRLPLVTLGIMAACLVVFVLTHAADERAHALFLDRLNSAIEFYWARPYLDLDPRLETTLLTIVSVQQLHTHREGAKGHVPPAGSFIRREEQRELDRLNHLAWEAWEQGPTWKYGSGPARRDLYTLVTHAFLHAG